MTERDELMLMERVRDHASLRQLGRAYALSHESARARLRKATHEHIKMLVAALWEAARDQQVLALAIPASFHGDRDAITYLEWVLSQMDELWGVNPVVHYRPLPDGGCVFGLEDRQMQELIERSRGEE